MRHDRERLLDILEAIENIYFGINLRQVWNTVEIHVPDLRQRVETILQQEPKQYGERFLGPYPDVRGPGFWEYSRNAESAGR